MSFQRTLAERAIWNFLNQAYPGRWIRANQSGDAPQRPFGTYLLSSILPIGHGDVLVEDPGDLGNDEQLTETMREIYETSASINFYGDKGETPQAPVRGADVLAACVSHAKRPSTIIMDDAGAICLGYMDASEIRDLAAVVGADWEGRAQVDMRFSARFDSSIALDWIRQIDISGAETTQTIEVTP